jgi:hypothetical protein
VVRHRRPADNALEAVVPAAGEVTRRKGKTGGAAWRLAGASVCCYTTQGVDAQGI